MPEFLTTHRGIEIAGLGVLGPNGPPGATGPPGGASYTTTIGDGSSTTFTITHNLNTQGVQVAVFQAAAPFSEVAATINHTSANTITLVFASAPAASSITVVVSGPGSTGAGGDLNFTFTQPTPTTSWSVVHGLGKYPSVSVVDNSNNLLVADVQYVDTNSLTVTFVSPTSGRVFLN